MSTPKEIRWGSSLDAQLSRLIEQEFVRRVPSLPIQLPAFDSTGLPDPAKYPGCIIYARDTAKVMFSDGAAWGNV
jgi:hypothetical protein